MVDTDSEGSTAKMTLQEHAEYKTELKNELTDLEFAQAMVPSLYKERRIKILKKRLDIPVD